MKSFLCILISVFSVLRVSAGDDSEWTVLFDGASLEQWRGFRTDQFPAGSWTVEEGILTSIGGAARVDLVTKSRYTDFELELEWMVEAGGNSGIFYRVSEEVPIIWHLAPEYQIVDDEHVKNPVHSAGALYDLVAPNDRKALRPPGEFNASRVVIQGDRIEHWLNGKKVVSVDFGDARLKKKIAASKFTENENFGQVTEGHLALQHHGDSVGFRNIRIRELSASRSD